MTDTNGARVPVTTEAAKPPKTRGEVETLKLAWLKDPVWDIEDTEGFEPFRYELAEYHDRWTFIWETERKQKAEGAKRSEHDLLVSLAQLGEEQLAVSRHILAAMGASATSRSSVELAQTSKGVNITVKSYEGSDVDIAGVTAIAEFGVLFREVERQQLNGWRETIEAGTAK